MASYVDNQPRQFNKYTPTIDSQVLAQELAKNDTDYETGVQRVNSSLQAVAGLPVASVADQNYLQQKVNGVSTSINQMVGTDYSSQKISGMLAGQASAIYTDPNVQIAVQNASTVKRAYSDKNEDTDRSKGKNIANTFDLDKNYNTWANSNTVGHRLDLGYTPYTDSEKTLNDYWAGKHPNQIVRMEGNSFKAYEKKDGSPLTADDKLAMSNPLKWEAVKHTFIGITTDDAKSEIQGFVNTNPELGTQLGLESKYNYRTDNGSQLYNDYKKSLVGDYYDNKSLIHTYTNQLQQAIPGTTDYTRIQNQITNLQFQTDHFESLTEHDLRNQFSGGLNSKEAVEDLQKNLFTKNWVDNQARNKSYSQEDINLSGMSPKEQDFRQQEIQNTILTRQDNEKERAFRDGLDAAKFAETKLLDTAKIAKLTGSISGSDAPFETPAGINIAAQTKLGSQDQLLLNIDNTEKMLTKNKNDFMYSTMQPVQAEQLFTTDVDGKVIPKNDSVQKQITDNYNQLWQRYQNNDSTLDTKAKAYFDKNGEDIILNDLQKQKNLRNQQAWNSFTKSDPTTVATYKSLDALNSLPIPVKAGPGLPVSGHITGTDIEKYQAAQKDIQAWRDKNKNYFLPGGATEEEQTQAENLIYKQYGLDPKTAIDIPTFAGDYLHKLAEVGNTRSKFLNSRIAGSQVYTAQTARSLLDGNKTDDAATRANAKTILAAQGIDSKTFDNDQLNIVGTQDPISGQYSVVLQDPTDVSKSKVVQVDAGTADKLGLTTLITTDPILKRIAANDDRGISGNTGNPEQGGMTFANGFKTGQVDYQRDEKGNKVGEPMDIRYHVEHDPSGYYLSILGKGQSSKTEVLIKKYPPLPFQQMKQTLNSVLGKSSAPTRPYDFTIDNNTNSILSETTSQN